LRSSTLSESEEREIRRLATHQKRASFEMKLSSDLLMQSQRLSWVTGIALVGALGGIYGIASSILLNSFAQVEQQQMKDDVAQAGDAVNDNVKLVANRLIDYAAWDQNYWYVEGKNPNFCQTDITQGTFVSGEINFVAIARSNGEIICRKGFDLEQQKPIPLSPSLQSHLTATNSSFKDPHPQKTYQGLLKLPDGLLIIASSPVLNSEGEGAILGSMVVGKYLNLATVKAFSEATRLNITIRPIVDLPQSEASQAARLSIAPKNTIIITPLDQNSIAGYTLLHDLYGQPVAMLQVQSQRTVYQQGILSLKYLGVSLLVVGGAAGSIIRLLLHRIVTSVRERDRLEQSLQQEAALRQSEAKYRTKAEELEQTLIALQNAQAHLVQSEKMSSLGQLVAGIAHEINNPVNFIHGNIAHLKGHVKDLMKLVELYQRHYPKPIPEIQTQALQLDTNFLIEDLPLILSSLQAGSERIREIVLSLRNFSRLDESDMKFVNIHEGIDSSLLILQSRLNATRERPEILVVKDYGNLPLVECYPGQLNQVLMSLLVNAIDAIDEAAAQPQSLPELPKIHIRSQVLPQEHIAIHITDNGIGIPEAIQTKLFDPFFTTKPVGSGTGMGLAICYQIVVEKHQGQLRCYSQPKQGAEFVVQIPIQPSRQPHKPRSDKENLSASPLFHNH
jgi:two-component system, NtrC family, sensor kinase